MNTGLIGFIIFMKRFFTSVFMLIIFGILLISLSNLFFGNLTKKIFISAFHDGSGSNNHLLHTDLGDYQRKVLGAIATLKISSELPLDRFGEMNLTAKLLNGPVFVTKTGVSLGKSRWLIILNDALLNKDQKALLNLYFPEGLPKLVIRIGFDDKVYYSSHFKTPNAKVAIKGSYDVKTNSNQGEIRLDDFVYPFSGGDIASDQLSIKYQVAQSTVSSKVITQLKVNMDDSNITLKQALIEKPVQLTLNFSASINNKNDSINGELITKVHQQSERQIPVDDATMNINFKEVLVENIIKYNQILAELDNLKQQASWSLEETGEYPEGQDRIWQLYDEMDKKVQTLQTQLKDVLNENSLIGIQAELAYEEERSTLAGVLKKATAQQPSKIVKNRGGGYYALLSLMQGEAEVVLTDRLYSYLKSKSPIQRSKFKLILKDSKLLMQ